MHFVIAYWISLVIAIWLITVSETAIKGVPDQMSSFVGDNVTFNWTSDGTILSANWGVRSGSSPNPSPQYIVVDDFGETVNTAGLDDSLEERIAFTGNLTEGRAWFAIYNLIISDSKEYIVLIREKSSSEKSYYVVLTVGPRTTTAPPTTLITSSTSTPQSGSAPTPTTTPTSTQTTTKTTTGPPGNGTAKPVKRWIAPVAGVCGGVLLVLIVILCCYCFCHEYLFKCCNYICCCCPKAVRDWFHRVFCDRCRDCCSFCCGVCCCCCAKYIKKQEHEMKPLPADSTGAPSAAPTAATTAVSPAATTAVSPAASAGTPPAASTAASYKSNRSE